MKEMNVNSLSDRMGRIKDKFKRLSELEESNLLKR